ncbi:hypothetical protein [Marinactinospora rubrisoli]|uniref:Uncharacterized protein n=1 Tax=Marinactinospora rubrisoli TaxID=2715399 RepID=A0ABW2KLZ0_9ACTN
MQIVSLSPIDWLWLVAFGAIPALVGIVGALIARATRRPSTTLQQRLHAERDGGQR